jgi:hypothetical protein
MKLERSDVKLRSLESSDLSVENKADWNLGVP